MFSLSYRCIKVLLKLSENRHPEPERTGFGGRDTTGVFFGSILSLPQLQKITRKYFWSFRRLWKWLQSFSPGSSTVVVAKLSVDDLSSLRCPWTWMYYIRGSVPAEGKANSKSSSVYQKTGLPSWKKILIMKYKVTEELSKYKSSRGGCLEQALTELFKDIRVECESHRTAKGSEIRNHGIKWISCFRRIRREHQEEKHDSGLKIDSYLELWRSLLQYVFFIDRVPSIF
jgi:hypothetical protein